MKFSQKEIRSPFLGGHQIDLIDHFVDSVRPVLETHSLDSGDTTKPRRPANHGFQMIEDRVGISCRLQVRW